LAVASTPAPACPDKGKRVLVINSDSEDSGGALVFRRGGPRAFLPCLPRLPVAGVLSGTILQAPHRLCLEQSKRNKMRGPIRFPRRYRYVKWLRLRVLPPLHLLLLLLPASHGFPAPSTGS